MKNPLHGKPMTPGEWAGRGYPPGVWVYLGERGDPTKPPPRTWPARVGAERFDKQLDAWVFTAADGNSEVYGVYSPHPWIDELNSVE